MFIFVCSWKIKGRCIRKSEIRPYNSNKGKPGTMIIFDFEDESGLKIKGIAFNDATKTLDKEISVGKNYAISKGRVQDKFGHPVKGYHNYELLFFKHSQVNCVMVGSLFIQHD